MGQKGHMAYLRRNIIKKITLQKELTKKPSADMNKQKYHQIKWESKSISRVHLILPITTDNY